jgi:hypothetical protein
MYPSILSRVIGPAAPHHDERHNGDLVVKPTTRAAARLSRVVTTRAAVLTTVLGLVLVAACADVERPMVAPRARPSLDVAAPNTDALPQGHVLGCPPKPGVTTRRGAAGSTEDVNANGVVCDQAVGDPLAPTTFTSDDVPIPAFVVDTTTPPAA